MTERWLEVLAAGPQATVQDLGRPGWAHLGVPGSGALDLPAHRVANRLVGNRDDAAGLECLLGAVSFRLTRAAAVAVTGARVPVLVDGRAVAWGAAVSVPEGAVTRIGVPPVGLRCYLAIAGGVLVEPVLGSRSTDLLSGLGPAVLVDGARLPLGEPVGPPAAGEAIPAAAVEPVVRVRLGPRDDWFAPASLAALAEAAYVVDGESNRVGLRLRGRPLERAVGGELPSEGMVLGAVQVPPGGQPVIFLNDHPTTGGYPVIGVVLAADLPVCAQARPGETLRIRVVR